MKLLEQLTQIWSGGSQPFLIYRNAELHFSQISAQSAAPVSTIKPGEVVALIGDFDPPTISALLHLIDLGAIVVPLTKDTAAQHEYFFTTAAVDVVIEYQQVTRRQHNTRHALIDQLKSTGHAGLVLFSTGTTGRPKAILHDLTLFLKRYETPRPALRTLNFLLFDHIGGINTLLHTLFNKGVVVAPPSRTVESVLTACADYGVQVLPTTPTFLRMMLIAGAIPKKIPASLQIITYGTERMDQPTLDELCKLLPQIDFRQTFGMSELGIVRVRSEARNSLFMKIGGEGVRTRVVNGVLQIHSESRMLGYLNAESPFDAEGWYDTGDVVEEKNGFYKVVGRTNEVFNVGGLKFMASEVEQIALQYPGVSLVKVHSRPNPITGQHVEMTVQPAHADSIQKEALMAFLKSKLQSHMVPRRIQIEQVNVGHRFKKA